MIRVWYYNTVALVYNRGTASKVHEEEGVTLQAAGRPGLSTRLLVGEEHVASRHRVNLTPRLVWIALLNNRIKFPCLIVYKFGFLLPNFAPVLRPGAIRISQ